MSLEQKVMQQMKEAMKSKDTIALESLRAIKSAILLEISSGTDQAMNGEKEIQLLQKLVKQRKESARQFKEQDREQLAEKETKQAEVIMTFLPKQLSREGLKQKIGEIITEMGATSMKDMGKVMGRATAELKGRAEGKLISEEVKSLLS